MVVILNLFSAACMHCAVTVGTQEEELEFSKENPPFRSIARNAYTH